MGHREDEESDDDDNDSSDSLVRFATTSSAALSLLERLSMSRVRLGALEPESERAQDEGALTPHDQRVRQRIRNHLIRTAVEHRPSPELAVAASRPVRVPLHGHDLQQNLSRSVAAGTEGNCTVCMTDMAAGERIVTLPCMHTFHEECGERWLREYARTCPICRRSCGRSGTPRS